MDKINAKQLKEMLALSDEELEKVVGGDVTPEQKRCLDKVATDYNVCLKVCEEKTKDRLACVPGCSVKVAPLLQECLSKY